jgi:hypothetical protein
MMPKASENGTGRALYRAARNEQADAVREGGNDGPEREEAQHEHERALLAEHVAEARRA